MSTVSRYRQVAQISRAKGLTGEVVAVSDYSLPLRFWDGVTLALVPPEHDLPRTVVVEQATPLQDDRSFLLKMSQINDRTTAQKAVGCFLLARVEDCPELEESRILSVVGMTVTDKTHGFVGTIIEERPGKAQTIWVVADEGEGEGDRGEILIPAVDDFIIAHDEQGITVDLPEGLLELNA